MSRLQITNPSARLELRGTVRNPMGEFDFRADALALDRTNRELPGLQGLKARVSLNAEELRVDRLDGQVEGQAFSVEGEVRLGTNFWAQRREEIAAYLIDNARMRLVAEEVELAPFAQYAPRYLAPRGQMSVDLQLLPSRKLGGSLAMRGVETRPIARVGVVQEMQADLSFDGTVVRIEDMGGVIGGERLTITGAVDFAEEHLSLGYPRVDLAIRGQNVPLARNPDVILRSDLDLTVRNGTNMVPVIAGDVTLQDSFLMRDIATLVPGRVASPERRPPYFTMPMDPVDDWTLDVRVRGVNFMRIRSPFFHGVASANFHVTRTMEEPMALGEANISSGRIIFPFASLEVRQAIISLTSENPYVPRVFVTAGGRAFGFDVRMQVEGFADEPVIEFSSVPALTSEQIILMLTTGQIPRDDFGFSREDRAGKLAFFLGKSLWEKWNPGRAGEERLTIRSGQDITEQGRQTYEVEYRLSDRWSLVGEYDRFGALNANVKWRLFER
jgi:translocation and assembly module TamB